MLEYKCKLVGINVVIVNEAKLTIIKLKWFFNSFYNIRAVYDLNKQEIVNKDKIAWEAKDYKAIRMD